MIINEINDLLDLKVLLSDKVYISYNDKTYAVTGVDIYAYSIVITADTEESPITGKEIIDKIYELYSQYESPTRFDHIDLVVQNRALMYFNKPYKNKEILTICNDKNARKYTTILYHI